MKFTFTFFLVFTLTASLWAQLPLANFTIQDTSCLNEQTSVANNSINSNSYQWDFCVGDFKEAPLITSNISSTIALSTGLKIVEELNNYYGFALSNSKLYRYSFGKDLNNTSPVVTDLGDLGVLSNAEGIDIIKEGSQWVGVTGFGASANGGNLIRLVWSDISLSPTAEDIGNFNFTGRLKEIQLVRQGSKYILVTPYYNANKLIRIDFGSSMLNTPVLDDVYTSAALINVRLPFGMSILKKQGNWQVVLGSILSKTISVFDLGTDILSVPTYVKSESFVSFDKILKVKVIREDDNFYGLVSTYNGALHLIDLKGLNASDTFEEVIIADMPVVSSIDIIKEGSRHFVFGAQRKLQRLIFESVCHASTSYSTETSPNVSYDQAGNYDITLTAYDNSRNSDYITKSITIATSLAPQINIQTTGNCLSSPISFSGQELSGSINNWNWDFGDGLGTSNLQTDTYSYTSTREYQVKLNVTDANGCNNFIMDTIQIYEEPIPDFSYQGSSLCTNSPVSFTNNSMGETGSIVTWSWNFNSEGNSTEKNPSYTFSDGGDKNITLSASIPGCSSEVSKNISISPGPLTSFTFDGTCEYDQYVFANTTTGDDITGYQWDFGDGYFSSNTAPSHKFETGGNYVVSLTASNLLGCNTMLEKVVAVHFIPELNFTNDLACSDNTITFFDQSFVQNANIVGRNWTLKNTGLGYEQSSSGQSPSFLLEGDGAYEIMLIDESNYGCLDTLVRNVNVYQSPVADFTINNTCFGDSTLFTKHVELPDGTELVSIDWLIDGLMYSDAEVKHKFQYPGSYDTELYVRADNLCPDNTKKSLTINPLPEIDFKLSSACEDQLVAINSTINSPFDHVRSYNWLINNKPVSSQDQFLYEFSKADDYAILLGVTTDNNCYNSFSKNIPINPSPKSNFDIFPSYGASPLHVQFTDRSQGADKISYSFSGYNDDSSIEANPTYVYNDIGEDIATQIAENEFGCTDTSTQSIEVVIPIYDIAVSNVHVELVDGKLKLLIGLQNNGTIIINNPIVRVDIADKISLNHKIETVLLPGDYNEYAIDFNIIIKANEPLDYICFSVSTKLGIYEDVVSYDNEQCTNIDNTFNVLEPFPNPARTIVDIPVILPSSGTCDLQMTGENGSIVYFKKFQDLNSGLNMIRMDLTPYRKGFYILTVHYADIETTNKIVIQ